MAADERLGEAFSLRWRSRGYLGAERCHQLIVFGAFYLQHLKMRSITIHLDRFSRFCKHWRLREIWEDYGQRGRRCAGYLIGEASALHLDGIYAIDALVIAIDIELALVHLQKSPFNLEVLAVFTTRDKKEKCEKKK